MPVKKQPSTRSSAAKKKPVAKKVTAKKAVVAKKIPKKVAKKAVKKTATKKAPKKTTKTVEKESKPEVVLPKNMSIRAREKSLVLQHEWRKAMYSIAYTSGLCFAVVGSAFALSSVFGNLELYGQSAQVSASQVQQVTIGAPELEITTTLPEVLSDEFRLSFTATNVSDVTAQVSMVGTMTGIPVEVNTLLNDRYRAVIPADQLSNGIYELVVFPIPENSSYGIRTTIVGSFRVGPAAEPIVDDNNDDETKVDNDINVPDDDIGTVPPVVIAPDVQTPTVTAPIAEAAAANFRIFSPANTLSGVVRIGLAVPENFAVAELYARPLSSLNPQFIGLATDRFGQKQFAFDSAARLPNGTYEFFARSRNSANEIVQTEGLRLVVSNSSRVSGNTTPATPAVEPAAPVITSEDSAPVRLPVVTPVREFTQVEFVPSVTVDDTVEQETINILNDNRTEIETLIRAYAVAKQSGDEMLVDAARNSLQEKRESLVFDAMVDDRVKDLADNIDVRIAEKLQDLEARTDAFEVIRSERSNWSSSLDTDEDGISDFDEENLYNTDPTEADTDNDGFTDGVEIIRGFNPLSEEAEAIIEFESPKDSFALVRDDVLSVDEVSAVLTTADESAQVFARIVGRGIPNSFVTVYIFSSPIVVTVRTDADGSFAYTLDRELADGTHDVFVALTDNTGSILGQSNPFSFIKEAEAFTPVDAAEEQVVTNENVVEITNQNTYGTVAGVGILALGIILIMLGVSLRSKKDEDTPEDPEPEDDLQSGRISDDAVTTEADKNQAAMKSSNKFEHIDAS